MTAPLRLTAALLLVAGLSACAGTSGGNRLTYDQELEQLRTDCTAREGILVQTGVTGGRPATNFVCRIRGATRLTN